MDPSRFDRFARHLAGGATRRGTLLGLAGGLLAPLLADGEADATGRHGDGHGGGAVDAENKNKRKKTCKRGRTRCGKKCVDSRIDPANCGGCGRPCTAPATCGGGNPGTPGACGCTKTTCAARGKNCGAIPDGCGGELQCGTCQDREVCGGRGEANVCGCRANGEVTTDLTCEECCSKDCCFFAPGQRVCAGGCG